MVVGGWSSDQVPGDVGLWGRHGQDMGIYRTFGAWDGWTVENGLWWCCNYLENEKVKGDLVVSGSDGGGLRGLI